MLNRLNIMQKTLLGFGMVLLLMVISSGVAWNGLSGATTGFQDYRKLARDSNFCSDIADGMMQIQFTAKNFDITSDPRFVERFKQVRSDLEKLLVEADERISDPEQQAMVTEIRQLVQQYEVAFDDMATARELRSKVQREVLDVEGPNMERNLLQVMQTAKTDDNVEAAATAGQTLSIVMQLRLAANRFIQNPTADNLQRTLAVGDKLETELEKLKSTLKSNERKQLVDATLASSQLYQPKFQELAQALIEERRLVRDEWDTLGPRVAVTTAKLRETIQGLQNELGPQVDSSNRATLVMVASVCVIAVILGVLVAILQSRAIVLPIRKVMGILGAVSTGDLRQRVDVNAQDEIGSMSKSLNTMVDNLQKAMTALTRNSEAIAQSAHSMSNTADSMSNVSSNTKSQSTSAAAAAEELSVNMRNMSAAATQMSTNMDSVASAVEEMSISIGQIANNMEQASNVSAEANRLADNSRDRLTELRQAASEIGGVVELIQDIAEQTNLLALNATIEAARAGESGKGFAVVAEEVKELARQTAKATEDIERRVLGIQEASGESLSSIDAIREVVMKMNHISQEVAAAIEEQSATTQEIAGSVAQTNSAVRMVTQSVSESATAGEEIARSVTSVDKSAYEVSQGAGQTKNCSGILSGISSDLQTLVAQFQI
ncbi:methyl-accepting chemotaxis protein [Bremerella sp. JC817]|uniref:HAMP domain-containing methyl-accepting chemotaxis protein n=1 Tax=Bremerella sp. JC817 TaxID=3231756 RepID=UPI003457BB5C